MAIKAILFDLGGVILRTIDFSPRERLAASLGMSRFDLEEFIFGRESGAKAQRGEITVRQHWDNLGKELHYSHHEFQDLLDEFFGSDVLDNELLDYVRELHKTYKTGLLSNAWDDLRQVIAEKYHFEDAFDDLVISAEVRLAKPDPRIFLLAVKRLGVEPNQAIFVDDMQRNVDGANTAGLWGIRFQTPMQTRSDIALLLESLREYEI
jgi:epoxide hydrolase-like predicted phosphatase